MTSPRISAILSILMDECCGGIKGSVQFKHTCCIKLVRASLHNTSQQKMHQSCFRSFAMLPVIRYKKDKASKFLVFWYTCIHNPDSTVVMSCNCSPGESLPQHIRSDTYQPSGAFRLSLAMRCLSGRTRPSRRSAGCPAGALPGPGDSSLRHETLRHYDQKCYCSGNVRGSPPPRELWLD